MKMAQYLNYFEVIEIWKRIICQSNFLSWFVPSPKDYHVGNTEINQNVLLLTATIRYVNSIIMSKSHDSLSVGSIHLQLKSLSTHGNNDKISSYSTVKYTFRL